MRTRATIALLAATSVVGPTAPALADAHEGDTEVVSASVNGGKPVVVGTVAATSFTATVTATDPAGIDWIDVVMYRGPAASPSGANAKAIEPSCTSIDPSMTKCTFTFVLGRGWLSHADAGAWQLRAIAAGKDGDRHADEAAAAFDVQRASKLTVNAAPEPVLKGKALTVTGKLSRANWETHDYRGYTAQPVRLQFRKKGSDVYTTVKTVRTDGTGNLKTTVTAANDGYWRWNFEGTPTTPACKAAGDFVDVR
ncbi:calcium-binding protein [Streptomyces sp. NPDC058572]|uniref:calcium-binding protein n=1 Tax=Streptomyces sp. NPDC058572 TaxID=3346546 RepID=UPI00365EEDFB